VLDFDEWGATCDTLHAYTQVLGKIAVRTAPPEPQLQHGALRLTARGWETWPLPAPDGAGLFTVALDLRTHEALVECKGGGDRRIPLTPNRAVADVTRDVLAAVRDLAGPVEINPKPQEVPWDVPLDEDTEHATYEPEPVETYFRMATLAADVLAELRAPWRGRSTPVNAWWGSFDLAVSFFSGRAAEPPSQDFIMRNSGNAEQVEVGWWPGNPNYTRAAFFGFVHPAPAGIEELDASPGHWDTELAEFVLDWRDVAAADDPRAAVLAFGRAFARESFAACGWDPELAGTLDGNPPPVV
jgi:hypothetical protein